MERVDFDRLTSAHAMGASRRGVVAGLGRGLLAALSLALVGSATFADAEAKGKKGRRKKKKKKAVSPSTPASPSSPPPPPTGPGSCPAGGPGWSEFTNGRMAQTFLPPQAGQLTEATIYLVDNPTFSLQFEIRKVDASGAPTNNVLAEAFVLGIQPTNVGDPPQAVTAAFANPATLTLGQPYALSVRATDKLYFVGTSGSFSDICQDGRMFRDEFAIGDFVALADGADMAYDLKIV